MRQGRHSSAAALLLVAASLCAAHASQASNHLGIDEAQHPQAETAPQAYHEAYHKVPWLAPASQRFPWEGVTSLPELAQLQGGKEGSTITAVVFSKPTSRWALNLIYSLLMLANVPGSYVAAVLDEASLADCQAWRLPCLDARWAMEYDQVVAAGGTNSSHGSSSGGNGGSGSHKERPATFASVYFHQINWAKITMVGALLDLGYHVHYTDTDVIYMRDAYASYQTLFHVYRADAVFMRESPLNAGTWVIRSNSRGRALVKEWLKAKPEADKINMSEQAALPLLVNKAFKFCYLHEECDSYTASNISTIFLHEMQMVHSTCPEGPVRHPCHPDRLFLHAICMNYKQKAMWFDQEKLWLIDGFAQPKYSPFPRHGGGSKHHHQSHARHLAVDDASSGGAGAVGARAGSDGKVAAPLRSHPFLPCPTPAWTYMTHH